MCCGSTPLVQRSSFSQGLYFPPLRVNSSPSKLRHYVVSPRVQGTNQWLISLYTTTARYIITFVIIISAETVPTTRVITVLYFLISCNFYSNFEVFKSVSRSFVFNSLKMFSFSLDFLVSVLVLFFFYYYCMEGICHRQDLGKSGHVL